MKGLLEDAVRQRECWAMRAADAEQRASETEAGAMRQKELPTEADMMAAAEIDSWRLERDSWRTLAKRQRRTIIKWENWENQQRHDCKLEREKTRKRFEEVFGPLQE